MQIHFCYHHIDDYVHYMVSVKRPDFQDLPPFIWLWYKKRWRKCVSIVKISPLNTNDRYIVKMDGVSAREIQGGTAIISAQFYTGDENYWGYRAKTSEITPYMVKKLTETDANSLGLVKVWDMSRMYVS